ncbi:hypothetical protein GOARA_082_00400 [Gordonia araii NBRC 100433]|uniref:Tat pathway signal sequence domain protein n=1 Tax=Gordonia araii NBRC 100433 TaxID=1073574 RepID=G7H727_9ACTN|nr:hypothetical protein GOARA_082_00400 [Gordonia araii NBRC 100433]
MRLSLRRIAVGVLVACSATTALATAPADAAPVDRYLDLPLINRDASRGPGGVHPVLPTDPKKLRALLGQARASGVAPTRYQALLWQYWLADTTTAAGINLAAWNPRAGVSANRANLVKSYRFYENLQLKHRELQWAGMGGLVGADFGGGLLDFELATNVYDFARLAPVANAIVGQTNQVLGPVFVDRLPRGLRALARVGATITAADLRKIQGDILVMQKNIFSDLMPMHRAYVVGGLPALTEMNRAGLFSDEILAAWTGIAGKTPDGVAAGNARLLRREQGEIIKKQWDATRAYKGDVGEAMTYASTAAGSPSVAGVVAPRSFRPIQIHGTAPDGRRAILTVPLPSWNWSVFDGRWAYITEQLLPKYRFQVEQRWPALRAELLRPYDQQIESHRPMWNILPTMQSALETLEVKYQ